MNAATQDLISVLREAQTWLARPENDFAWSSWENADEAIRELSAHLATLESDRLPPRLELDVLFAPTGRMQEVSLSSGWGEQFLDLAARFDTAMNRAYRRSLVDAVRAWLTSMRKTK